jgi:hypothetical protein
MMNVLSRGNEYGLSGWLRAHGIMDGAVAELEPAEVPRMTAELL